jgi:hypothetical protein
MKRAKKARALALARRRKGHAVDNKNEKLQLKITFKPPTPDYYTNSPIAPGFSFYQSVV